VTTLEWLLLAVAVAELVVIVVVLDHKRQVEANYDDLYARLTRLLDSQSQGQVDW
jgi:hypothetical protein